MTSTIAQVSFDQAQAEYHINLLGIALNQAIVQYVIPNGQNGWFHYNPDRVAKLAGKANIYIVANHGGRFKKDITACTNLRADYDDDRPLEDKLNNWKIKDGLEPTFQLITGSDKGGVHDVIRLASPLPPEEWEPLQIAHNGLLDGDPKLKSTNQPMRLAGTPYIDKKTGKPNGEIARLINVTDQAYTLEEVLASLPVAPSQATKPVRTIRGPIKRSTSAEYSKRTLEEIEHPLTVIEPMVSGSGNRYLYEPIAIGLPHALVEQRFDPNLAPEMIRRNMPEWIGGPALAEEAINYTNTTAGCYWRFLDQNFNYKPEKKAPKGAGLPVADIPDTKPSGKRIIDITHYSPKELTHYYKQLFRDDGVKSEDKVSALAFEAQFIAKRVQYTYNKSGKAPVCLDLTAQKKVIKWAANLDISIDPADQPAIKRLRLRLRQILRVLTAAGVLDAFDGDRYTPGSASDETAPKAPRSISKSTAASPRGISKSTASSEKIAEITCPDSDLEERPILTRRIKGLEGSKGFTRLDAEPVQEEEKAEQNQTALHPLMVGFALIGASQREERRVAALPDQRGGGERGR